MSRARTFEDKVCENPACGKTYHPHRERQRFCSQPCFLQARHHPEGMAGEGEAPKRKVGRPRKNQPVAVPLRRESAFTPLEHVREALHTLKTERNIIHKELERMESLARQIKIIDEQASILEDTVMRLEGKRVAVGAEEEEEDISQEVMDELPSV